MVYIYSLWLDLLLEVFSSLNDSLILWLNGSVCILYLSMYQHGFDSILSFSYEKPSRPGAASLSLYPGIS